MGVPTEMTALGDIVARARTGERKAQEELLERSRQRVFALCFHLLGPSDAEEAAQEALLKIFLRLEDLRDPEAFFPWALRVAGNLCRDSLRRRAVAAIPLDGVEVAADCGDPEAAAVASDQRERLRLAVDRLSPALRDVLLLRDVEGLSTEDTAAALDLPAGTVKSRLFEARKKMRNLLPREITA
ncbi:MAG: RNA polymerase sigma factor [Candidatus Eremiobacterota bacterium]